MFSLTGSRSGDREVARQPHFFEPFAVSMAALLGSLYIANWPLLGLARPAALMVALLVWGWLRLQPLAPFTAQRTPTALQRRPLLAMLAGAGVVLPLALIGAVVLWKGWYAEGAPVILLVAAVAGLPLGAAFWEDRFGRKARLARRRSRRHARTAG